MREMPTPIFGVPVISEERAAESRLQFGRVEGDDSLRTEDVFLETDTWEHGDEVIGVLYLRETRTGAEGRVLLTATFEFFDADRTDSLSVSGPASTTAGLLNSGQLGLCSGTGRFRRVSGTVEFESRNPKRWFVQSRDDEDEVGRP
ncbi:hypothetical protein [Tenggerimyces flavus]|uniref:Dirigent protein n=1 Tax=Tenggerimyces flavus TaxID=1708749 RepID=A0ABV7YJE4_9ACTN|nr:hypothetical protein [Tenggerimyces flavus]MBM7789691.1 hypothetical protein [Tenggerimyces flavus]